MKYFKTKFVIKSTNSKHIDETTLATTREICAALAGYAGYESFEDTEDGIDGYIQHNLFDQDILSTTFSDFPIEGVDVKATTSEVEDKNWNEAWEKHGFDPIIINNVSNIDVLHGNVDILNEIEGTFDIVLANINRNILIEDMAYMTMKMRTDSVFIISGFYTEDVSMLDEKAKTLGLFLECQKTSENWTMLKYTKK